MPSRTTPPSTAAPAGGLPRQRATATEVPADPWERARRDAVARYADLHGVELVADCFDAALTPYRQARVRAFVPVLVDRRLREALTPR